MTEDEIKAIEFWLKRQGFLTPSDGMKLIAEVQRLREQTVGLQREIDDLDDLVRPLPVCQP